MFVKEWFQEILFFMLFKVTVDLQSSILSKNNIFVPTKTTTST